MAGMEYGHARSGGLLRWGEREGGRVGIGRSGNRVQQVAITSVHFHASEMARVAFVL